MNVPRAVELFVAYLLTIILFGISRAAVVPIP